MNREDWLMKATCFMKKRFKEIEAQLPEKIRASCGFPHGAARRRFIGQCFYPEMSADETTEIFIHPVKSDSLEVGAIMAHELCHAALGAGFGHKKPFKILAAKMFLEGKATATFGAEKFKQYFQPFIDKHGDYPHASLGGSLLREQKEKVPSNIFNLRCPECNYFASTTKEFLDLGRIKCPIHKRQDLLTKEERKEQDTE